MAIFPSTAIPSGASDFTIPYSCRFEDGSSAYMQRTPSSTTDRKTFTLSFWMKRGNISSTGIVFCATIDHNGAPTDSEFFAVRIDSDDKIYIAGYNTTWLATSQLFRDPNAWYHIVVVCDSTISSPADNRVRMYVNGSQVTEFATRNNPAEDFLFAVNSQVKHNISSRSGWLSDGFYDGYLAEVHFIDGTALTPSSFGESGDYGEWKAKKVEGLTYGDNGFYLDFADSADLGDDESGEGNDWAESNITAVDQMLDSPTNNFATLNPLHPYVDHDFAGTSNDTFLEGNLKYTPSSDSGNRGKIHATMAVSSGKWYWEVLVKDTGTWLQDATVAIAGLDSRGNDQNQPGRFSTNSGGVTYISSGKIYENNYDGGASQDYGDSYTDGDIIGVALNMTTGRAWFSKNGVWQNSGDPAAGTNAATTTLLNHDTHCIPICYMSYTNTYEIMNFGQDSSFAGEKTAQGNQDGNSIGDFYYTPPTDFLALCTSNLPAVAVVPSENFNTVLYTGNATTNAIALDGMTAADMFWDKYKDGTGAHELMDRVRGFDKILFSNLTNAEQTNTDTTTISAGGTITYYGTHNGYNIDGQENVIWAWKAGNATLGTGAFTQGSIASTCSRNTDAGFSIVSFTAPGSDTGITIGHGLGVKPDMIIIKSRGEVAPWYVYHKDLTTLTGLDEERCFLKLDSTAANGSNTSVWDDEIPTSSVFSTSSGYSIGNDNGGIAYCFKSIDGFSKMGSYTGNGNADGTFVYTGFRPAFVLTKRTDSTSNWNIFDNKRNTYNVTNENLHPDTSGGEATDGGIIDILSNGFKARDTSALINASSGDYVYLAFAESPFKYSNAR
mgnify:CR=1 FL=1